MSVPDKVTFHITQAGPRMCATVAACPRPVDDPHFDNYLEAARAYEAELASVASSPEALIGSATITYDDLLVPQDDDIENAMYTIAGHCYRGMGPLSEEVGELHRDLWFDNQVENIAEVAPDDLRTLHELRAERAAAGTRSTRQLDAEIEAVVAAYRSDSVLHRYSAFLDERIKDSPEIARLAWKIAVPVARAKSFARALENRIPVPAAISAAFERIWNADAFTPGSQRFMEKELRSTVERRTALLKSPDRQAFADQHGFPNAKALMFSWNVAMLKIRKYYPVRGRNNPATVNTVIEALGLFTD